MSVAQGRFLSWAPWAGDHRRPQTLNGYSYADANPVNYVDPSGYWKCDAPAGVDCKAYFQALLGMLRQGGIVSRGVWLFFNTWDQTASQTIWGGVTLTLIDADGPNGALAGTHRAMYALFGERPFIFFPGEIMLYNASSWQTGPTKVAAALLAHEITHLLQPLMTAGTFPPEIAAYEVTYQVLSNSAKALNGSCQFMRAMWPLVTR